MHICGRDDFFCSLNSLLNPVTYRTCKFRELIHVSFGLGVEKHWAKAKLNLLRKKLNSFYSNLTTHFEPLVKDPCFKKSILQSKKFWFYSNQALYLAKILHDNYYFYRPTSAGVIENDKQITEKKIATLQLRCPGAKQQRWAPQLVASRFGVIPRV